MKKSLLIFSLALREDVRDISMLICSVTAAADCENVCYSMRTVRTRLWWNSLCRIRSYAAEIQQH
jgi:hypothetical protein